MDTSQNKELSDKIIALDISINKEFHKLIFLYWALKNSPIDNKVAEKQSFLKAYLYRNIISYKPYNLSENLVRLGNKKNTDKDKDAKYLSEYATGVIDAIKHIGIPFLNQRINYCSYELEELSGQVRQLTDFVNKTTDLREIGKFREMMDIFNKNMENQISIKSDDEKEKIIFANISETNFTPLNIKSLKEIPNTSLSQMRNERPGKKSYDIRIKSLASKQSIFNIFNDMKWTYLNFSSSKELNSIIKNHFLFDNINANSNPKFIYDNDTKIKWKDKNNRVLIHFIKQLIQKRFIDVPEHTFDILIEKHFYDDINDCSYEKKKVRDNANAMMKTNEVPKGHKEIDKILNKYLPSQQ